MKRGNHRYDVIGLTILAAIASGTFLLPETLTVPSTPAAAMSNDLHLTGIVRDFRSTHADFGVIPPEGTGHTAGNVGTSLDADDRPTFRSGGVLVMSEWRDDAGRPIAPHLFGVNSGLADPMLEGIGGSVGGPFGGVGIRVNGQVILDKAVLDSFDSTLGAYGDSGNAGGNIVLSTNSTALGAIDVSAASTLVGDVFVGPGGDPDAMVPVDLSVSGVKGTLSEPFPMPTVVAPTDAEVGPNVGDVWYKDDPFTISANLHTDNLRISSNAVVTIEGNVTILVEGEFTTETGGVIVVSPGSSLDLYVMGKTTIKTKSAWSDPRNTRMWVIGSPELKLETEAAFYGTIIAPEARLIMKTKAQLYGSFVGDEFECITEAVVHMDRAAAPSDTEITFGPGLAVAGKYEADTAVIDGYDSSAGPYGGANSGLPIVTSSNLTTSNIINLADTIVSGDVLCGPGGNVATAIKRAGCSISGTVGTLTETVPIPSIAAPTGLGPSVGDVTYNGGESTLSSDLHCDALYVDGGGILWIDGQLTVYCEKECKVSNSSEIRLRPGATLRLFVQKDFKLENGAKINANTRDPQRVVEFHIQPGSDNIKVDGGSELHARVIGAGGSMTVSGSQFYGTFIGQALKAENNAGVHIDLAGISGDSCVTVDDTAGLDDGTSDAGITSAASFAGWFRDVLGVNRSNTHTITLTDIGGGVWEYETSDFHPVDGRGFGGDGDGDGETHNDYFTYAIEATFTYAGCGGGQFLEFEGGDSAWAFIDGQLVLDLGGVRSEEIQYVDLDRLGLQDGATYTLHFFYAHRHAASEYFRLRTNIELSTDPSDLVVSGSGD